MVRRPFLVFTLTLATLGIGTGAATAASPAGSSTTNYAVFTGDLDASQVVAGSSSTATGHAVVTIDATNPVAVLLITDLSWTGLTGPADRTHIHSGPPGSATDDLFFHEVADFDNIARTVVPCPWGDATFANCLPTTGTSHDELDVTAGYSDCPTWQCIVDMAIPNGFFLDMHTQLYPSGEIRGQLTFVTRRPDVRVRVGASGAFVGDGVYNQTANHQQVTTSAHPGSTIVFEVSIQNDAPKRGDTFLVTVSGPPVFGYVVRYFDGATDVTTPVVTGTYHTGRVRPGRAATLRVSIKVSAGASPGTSVARTITVTSDGDPSKVDVVKLTLRRS